MRDPPLTCRTGQFFDQADRTAYDLLLSVVLERPPDRHFAAADPWLPIALFAPEGACVANVDVAILRMIADDKIQEIAAIRSVAVAAPWRGRGLFRRLMQEALAWCDARAPATILYTEDPLLYARFGFSIVAQHAVVGPPPGSCGTGNSRILDLNAAEDCASVLGQIGGRAWPSQHVALAIDASTWLHNVRDLNLTIARIDALAAIILYETSGDEVALYDVVATRMLRLDEILAHLPLDTSTIRVLFPTDQLGWSGRMEPEDTGLLLRGRRPGAFDRPFMITPTAEF